MRGCGKCRRKRAVLLAWAVLPMVAGSAKGSSVAAHWLGTSNGSWNSTTGWSTAPAYPNNTTDTCYAVTIGSGSVSLNIAGVTVDSLNLTGGTLTLKNPISFSPGGMFAWSGGALGNNNSFPSLTNPVGQTVVLAGPSMSAPWISNNGTIVDSYSGTTVLAAYVDNFGTISATAGTLQIKPSQSGGTYGGTISPAVGATVQLYNGGILMNGVTFAGGVTELAESAGPQVFSLAAGSIANVSGTLQLDSIQIGPGLLNVVNGGKLNWSSSPFQFAYAAQVTGGINVASGGQMTLLGSSFSAGTAGVTNAGTITMSSTFNGAIDELAIKNSGTIVKTSALEEDFLGNIAGTGMVSIAAGTLMIEGPLPSLANQPYSGSWTIAAGSSIVFNNTAYGQTNSLSNLSISGVGHVHDTAGTIIIPSGTTATTSAPFDLDGGTLNVAGTLNVTGGATLAWISGSLVGSGKIFIRSGSAIDIQIATATLSASQLTNSGSVFLGGAGINQTVTLPAVTLNPAVLSKSGAGTTTYNGSIVQNGGTISASGGTLILNGNSTYSGTFSAATGATIQLQFTGNGTVGPAGVTFSGAGTTSILASLTCNGPLTIDGKLSWNTNGFFNAGGISVSSGGSFIDNGIIFGSPPISIAAGGTMRITDRFTSGATPITISNSGTITLGSSLGNQITDPFVLTNSGVVGKTATAATTFQGTFTNNGVLHVSAGSLVIPSLTNSGTVTIDSGTSLTINGGLSNSPNGVIDVNQGVLVYGSAGGDSQGMIRSLLASGFNGGNWNGAGISSTAAHNDSTYSTALGYSVDSSAITVKCVSYGDCNVDGIVDVNDFSMLIDGLVATSASAWSQGDFTYDGKVDLGNDFNLFLVSYLKQGGSLGDLQQAVAASPELSGAQCALLLGMVPEPASTALVAGLSAYALLRRRRKLSPIH
jgi:hypothetical protein